MKKWVVWSWLSLLFSGIQLTCVSAQIQKFPNVDIIYPDGMAVKETSTGDTHSTLPVLSAYQLPESSFLILSTNGVSASTMTSTWTILPLDISISNPTIVVQIKQPDTTLTITAEPVTIAGTTATQTVMLTMDIINSKPIDTVSPVTSFVTGPPLVTTSTSTVIKTVLETGSMATVTSTFTVTKTSTPSSVTANTEIVTKTSLQTASSTLTSLVTMTPSPVYSTVTLGSRVLITIYSSIKVAAPQSTSLSSLSPSLSSSPSPEMPSSTPESLPSEQQQQQQDQQPLQTQSQQPAEQSSRSVICSWKVIGGRTIYRCHYSDEPWW